MTRFTFNDGSTIPAIGLGTWRSRENDAYRAVRHALDVGYRHIDTAEIYGNEAEIGRAIAESGVPREQIFVTSKVWNTHWTREQAAIALDESLSHLGTGYLDLYLIHWAGPYERIRDVWRALEDAVAAEKVRSIGVSNFHAHHINALLETANTVPAVNQVECHPHLQNVFLQRFVQEHGMLLEAYAPLNSDHIQDLLDDETLQKIAGAHGKTVPQVVLRWHIQRGIVALPKSVTPSRIEENFQVFDFELTTDEMKAIRALNQGAKHFPEPDNVDFGFAID
jgi:diketogulonate reductase-like aldo/keto reductase